MARELERVEARVGAAQRQLARLDASSNDPSAAVLAARGEEEGEEGEEGGGDSWLQGALPLATWVLSCGKGLYRSECRAGLCAGGLIWQDINILHITDVHSWVSGSANFRAWSARTHRSHQVVNGTM